MVSPVLKRKMYVSSIGVGLPRFHGLFAFKPQHLLSV
jgi:hypothetical protein